MVRVRFIVEEIETDRIKTFRKLSSNNFLKKKPGAG